MESTALYRVIWRWHFYAGLLVLPFILILAGSGTLYLFKPQVERWEERAFQNLPTVGAVPPTAQAEAALAAFPASSFVNYRLPERPGDAAMIHLKLADSHAMADVFVSPQGVVLGSLASDDRIIAVDRRLHGQLFLGPRGSWLVELVASWTIVMVLSGLFLWWPRGQTLAGVVWPRLSQKNGRGFWRDLHAVTGFWISAFVLVLLVTGLPWAGVWGDALKSVRGEMGWVRGEQDWTLGGKQTSSGDMGHSEHNHSAMVGAGHPIDLSPLSHFVAKAESEGLAFPVLVVAPASEMRGDSRGAPAWTVMSDAQNRPLRVTIHYDANTHAEISRETFAQKHIIDRIVAYGIAWHEGHLFGWVNQLIGVLTATGLAIMTVSGFVMWRRRKPKHLLGAPPLPFVAVSARLGIIVLLILAVLLPLLAASLIAILLLEKAVLPHLPGVQAWLGFVPRHASDRAP